MRTIYYISLFLGIALLTGCAERLYKRGKKNYEKMEYYSAIDNLERYLGRCEKPDAALKLADSYRRINDFSNAEKWYAKVIDHPETQPEDMFKYAKILMTMEKYTEAKKWFEKYLTFAPDDFVAEMLLASSSSVDAFKKDTTLYTINAVDLPDVAAAFGPAIYNEGIVFTADKIVYRNSDRYSWTGRSYLGLYYSKKDESGKWLSPSLLKGDVNGEFHEGPACFTKEGDVVYFTRSNTKGKRLKTSSKNENNLKIYRAELIDNKWKNLDELPFNSDEYSCGHPTLSADNKTLYFISDMPGGMGGTDLYKSTLTDGVWSKPENLGNAINTEGNEMFPYMHSDGTLYFSSNAHNNLGGLDIFMSYYDEKNWLHVENMNYPVNTSKDDYGFVWASDNKTGYLSSNRGGEDKIYEVTKSDPKFFLTGFVKQKGSTNIVDSAVIEIINQTNNTKETYYTGKTGLYKIKLDRNKKYVVKAGKAMHFPVTPPINISTEDKKSSEDFVANFEIDAIIMEKPIRLSNIYYDLGKWEIRPDAAIELDKLIEVLLDNPGISIELGSHTDSRAGDKYNLLLSEKRAKAAVEYMISKGIQSNRLRPKGYGETVLLNKCKNKVPCTEEEHQQNRRTEFKAIKIRNLIVNK